MPAPARVFLHGSGGNFKVYVWLLSKVADETWHRRQRKEMLHLLAIWLASAPLQRAPPR